MTNLFNILASTMAGKDFAICPICKKPGDLGESNNLKVCLKCQEDLLNKLDDAIDPETKLMYQYSNN
jgi:hypothetical protein